MNHSSSKPTAAKEAPEARQRRAGHQCRRAVLFLFALFVAFFAFQERMAGPLPLVLYLIQGGIWGLVMLPLVLAHFYSARWRLAFFALFYLCLGVVEVAPHPADPLIRDVNRIQAGMPVDKARSILARHIAEGTIQLSPTGDHVATEESGWLVYTAPKLESIDYIYIRIYHGQVQSATISWD
jgi:hypothetical protein